MCLLLVLVYPPATSLPSSLLLELDRGDERGLLVEGPEDVLGQLEALRQVLRGQCELQSGTGVSCLLQVPKTESVA